MSLESVAAVTKTMGHTARLRILAMLRHGRLSVCQIASVLAVPPSTASGYLLELRRAGLVREHREGKWVYHHLSAEEPIDVILRMVLCMASSDPQIRADAEAARTIGGTSPEVVCGTHDENGAARLCRVEAR